MSRLASALTFIALLAVVYGLLELGYQIGKLEAAIECSATDGRREQP